MNNNNLMSVIETFKNRNNFLITAHVNPEGDSIASQLAVYTVLKNMAKRAVMVDCDNVPDNLKFLPSSELIMKKVPHDFKIETVIMLDCPVKERAGEISGYINQNLFVVNIDHHISNEFFGSINWVEPGASSVGEMIFYLIKMLGMAIDKSLATILYTAIITDTGMFNYSNTGKATHQAAGELIEIGINPKEIHSQIFEKKSLPEIRLLARALGTLQLESNGQLAHMSLTKDMYDAEGVESISTDEFINFPRSIKGVKVAIFFKENVRDQKLVNISFRSSGDIDVNLLASAFGGGGHAQASGCLLDSGLQRAREKVLAEAKKILNGEKFS